MKTKINYIYFLAFCYSIFTFAVFIPSSASDAKSWILSLFFSGIVEIIIIYISNTGKQCKPLANLFILIYLFVLMARQIANMCEYMKLYHGQRAGLATIIIGFSIIVICALMDKEKIILLSYPVFAMIIIMLLLCVVLNFTKINSMNIYKDFPIYTNIKENIIMFDNILPVILWLNFKGIKNKKQISLFVIIQKSFLILLSLFCFLCLSGNLMYNVSPLQALFQISSTKFIRNYDAFYNFFLFFGFFSSIITLTLIYKLIKTNFNYTNYSDLLLPVVFLFLQNYMDNYIWFIMEILITVIVFIGKEKMNEKS